MRVKAKRGLLFDPVLLGSRQEFFQSQVDQFMILVSDENEI